MHSFNFRNCQWREWPDCQLPPQRDSFGLAAHLNELYLFGGSSQDQQFGDTHIYSTFSSSWRQLEAEGPSPRNPMVFIDVGGLFIFLYGGVEVEAGNILEDAYILLEGLWKQLEVVNAPRNLVGAQAVACQQKVFLFGG
jgi:N-acetylneuraminic acid mutarotase